MNDLFKKKKKKTIQGIVEVGSVQIKNDSLLKKNKFYEMWNLSGSLGKTMYQMTIHHVSD